MTKDEIFDIVDDQDNVLRQETRSEVHRQKLKHRAVHILIFNEQEQLFLQKRSLLKDNFPGLWDSSVAGHLDAGEDYDVACIREVNEELNVTFEDSPERLFKIDSCQETGYEFIWVYRGLHEGPFNINRDEIDCGEWYNTEEVKRWVEEKPMDFASAFVLIWKLYYG
jgi:isopentenyl-diphosphate delta-isomerase type 1